VDDGRGFCLARRIGVEPLGQLADSPMASISAVEDCWLDLRRRLSENEREKKKSSPRPRPALARRAGGFPTGPPDSAPQPSWAGKAQPAPAACPSGSPASGNELGARRRWSTGERASFESGRFRTTFLRFQRQGAPAAAIWRNLGGKNPQCSDAWSSARPVKYCASEPGKRHSENPGRIRFSRDHLPFWRRFRTSACSNEYKPRAVHPSISLGRRSRLSSVAWNPHHVEGVELPPPDRFERDPRSRSMISLGVLKIGEIGPPAKHPECSSAALRCSAVQALPLIRPRRHHIFERRGAATSP